MPAYLNNRSIVMILLVITIVAGYLGFRYFYGVSGDFPFSQELILVFIGAIATVLITALLLSQQTELELRKEGQVLLLDHKSSTYTALIEHIGEIVEKGAMTPDQYAELRILNHKLAMIAEAEVIRAFRGVLAQLDDAVQDKKIAETEQDKIMHSVAILTYHMRRDLLGRVATDDGADVLQDILSNNADLDRDGAGR